LTPTSRVHIQHPLDQQVWKWFDDTTSVFVSHRQYHHISTMLSTGFADAPVSRSLAYGIVAASILASVLDVKHYFYIQVDPHL